ncbi:fimbrial protein [Enterobacter bugandensis]|uniref:fimbrial protein n=1 Tax=Enterobacter bugandensis TaxID=881260 RepID=UPI0006690555|nr:fimbrial protein [Enterobacter bugandensis]
MKKTVGYSLLLLVAMIKMASAACTPMGSGREGTVLLDFTDVAVLPNTPNGSVVATAGGSNGHIADAVGVSMGAFFMRCDEGDLAVWGGSSYGTVEYNGETLLDSGVPGLGIRTRTGATTAGNSNSLGAGVKFPPDYSGVIDGRSISTYHYGQRRFELVKIGDVEGGIIPGGTLVTSTVGGTRLLTWELKSSSVATSGCEATDFPNEVSLGSAYSQQFRNPGDTQNETAFSITLTCDSTSIRPAITFDGDIDDVAYPTVFSNGDGEGYAQNVGVQLSANGSVITPGSPVSLGQSASLVTDYAFSASLRRTGDTVTAGSVDIPVVFVLTYE